MTSHKHSHDTGRAPLRLRPLPRPSRPSAPEPADDAESEAAPPADDPDVEQAPREPEDDPPSGDWIHEWEQPETGA